MATNTTDNLRIPLILGTTRFSRDSINDGFYAIDSNALNKSHAIIKAHWELWKAKTKYNKHDVFKTSNVPSWGYWKVITAGISGTTEPNDTELGSVVTNGTCEFILCSITGSSSSIVDIERSGDNIIFSLADGQKPKVSINDVTHASSADRTDIAIKAEQDKNGIDISTYVKDVSYTDNQLEIQKGDGNTKLIPISGGSGGVVGGYVKDIAAEGSTITVGISGDATKTLIIDNVANAETAKKDINGEEIISYVKDVDGANGVATVTQGNGNTHTFKYGNINSIRGDNATLIITDVEDNVEKITINNVSNASSAKMDTNGKDITSYVHNFDIDEDGNLKLIYGDGNEQTFQVNTSIPPHTIVNVKGEDDMLTFTTNVGDKITIAITNVKRAIADKKGNDITDYIKSLNIKNGVVTVIQGNGDISTYGLGTSGKVKNITQSDKNSFEVEDFDGNKQAIVINNVSDAVKATYDKNGNNITSYFFTANINNGALRLTRGDSKYIDITLPDDCVINNWQPNHDSYKANQIVQHDGAYFRAKSKHQSTQNFALDFALWEPVTNTINLWQEQRFYYVGMVIIYNNKLYRCINDHQAYSADKKADITPTNKKNWLEINSQSTTGVMAWSSQIASYVANQSLVTYNDSLYMCIVTHRPSKNFDDDFNLGYWKQVNSDITAMSDSGYYQSTKKNIVASKSSPYTFNLPINNTDFYCLPPIEVLKLADGLDGVTETAYNMVIDDAYDFSYNKEYMAFGDDLKPITEYELKISPPTPITDGTNKGYISETEYIDFSKYTNVSSINI